MQNEYLSYSTLVDLFLIVDRGCGNEFLILRSTLRRRGVLDSADGSFPDDCGIDAVLVGEVEGEVCSQGRGSDLDSPQCDSRFSAVDDTFGPLCVELLCQPARH